MCVWREREREREREMKAESVCELLGDCRGSLQEEWANPSLTYVLYERPVAD